MPKILREYLNQISEIDEKTFSHLETIFTPQTLNKGDFFAENDKVAKKAGFLISGVLRAFYVNNEGKEYTKQFFVGPSFIGAYTSLLTGQVNKIAQQALTDSEILEVDYKQLEELYSKHHSLERMGRKIAEKYFLEKEKKELEMGLLEGEERYAIFQQEFPGLEQKIPQYHVASYLGMSATQLSRIRKNLSKK